MLNLLLAGVLLAAQSQTVTFEHPCANSSVVLEALGKELGRTIKPSGSVNKDYFLVRFDNVPVKEAMDKIAETLNAKWSEERGVLYLGRTRKQETDEFYWPYQERAAILRRAISALDVSELSIPEAHTLAEKLRDFPNKDARDAHERKAPLTDRLPGARAMYRLMRTIDLDDIVLADGSPVIYSRDPETRPFPVASADVFSKLKAEWALFAEEARKVGLDSADKDANPYVDRRPDDFDFSTTFQLAAHVSDAGVLFMLAYNIDEKWHHLGYDRIEYKDHSAAPDWLVRLNAPPELSAVSMTLLYGGASEEERTDLIRSMTSDHAEDALLRPVGEAILQAARQLGVSAVALVPDSSLLTLSRANLKGAASLSQLLVPLVVNGNMRASLQGAWMTFAPSAPYSDRRNRIERRALQRIAGKAAASNPITLDDFCEFALSTVSAEPFLILNAVLAKSSNVRLRMPDYNIEAFKLYGLLSESEKAQAAQSELVLYPRLDSERFLKILGASEQLKEGNYIQVGRLTPFTEDQSGIQKAARKTAWSLQVRTSPFFVPVSLADPDGLMQPMDVESLAASMEFAGRRSYKDLDFSTLAVVEGTTIFLQHKGGGGGGTMFARFFDPLTKPQFGSFNDLKPEDQRLIREAQERRRKEH